MMNGWIEPAELTDTLIEQLRLAIDSQNRAITEDQVSQLVNAIERCIKRQYMANKTLTASTSISEEVEKLKDLVNDLEKANRKLALMGETANTLNDLLLYLAPYLSVLTKNNKTAYTNILQLQIDSANHYLQSLPKTKQGRKSKTDYTFMLANLAEDFVRIFPNSSISSGKTSLFYAVVQFVMSEILATGIDDPSRHIETLKSHTKP